MASLDDLLSSVDWIYSEGFDKVKIPNVLLEAIFNDVAVLESASKIDSTCKNNERVVTAYVMSRQ